MARANRADGPPEINIAIVLEIVSILLAVTAVLAFINTRFLRQPPAIGLLITALASALVVKALGVLGLVNLNPILALLRELDFRAALLDGMLGLLLFAAALHVDPAQLRAQVKPIAALATLGTRGVPVAAVSTSASRHVVPFALTFR